MRMDNLSDDDYGYYLAELNHTDQFGRFKSNQIMFNVRKIDVVKIVPVAAKFQLTTAGLLVYILNLLFMYTIVFQNPLKQVDCF